MAGDGCLMCLAAAGWFVAAGPNPKPGTVWLLCVVVSQCAMLGVRCMLAGCAVCWQRGCWLCAVYVSRSNNVRGNRLATLF